MRKIRVSVVMAVFIEKEKFLCSAIESILEQSFKELEFIIVLDNPANVRAREIIKYFQKKDDRIVFLENKENRGLAFSLNLAIKQASGEYIARMDGDDVSKQERVSKQVIYLDNHPKVDFLFGWVDFIDENNNIIKAFRPDCYKVRDIRKYFFSQDLLVHPVLLVRSKIIKALRYDEKFLKSQDFELWLRTINNFRFDLINDCLMLYRVPSKVNFSERIEKIRKSSFWGIKAMNKNFKYYIYDWRFWRFYFKLIIFAILVKLPKKILCSIIRLADK